MTDALALSDAELDRAIKADADELRRALSSAVEVAWRMGHRLTVRKRRLPHGAWLPYLDRIGLPARTDPDKRAQLGAYYTDRDKIMLLVEPVVVKAAARRVERREDRDHRRAGTWRRGQVPPRSHKTAERGRAAVPGVPQPAARIHGARPGLRLGRPAAGSV